METVKYSEDGKILCHCQDDYEGKFVIPDRVTKIGICAFDETLKVSYY